MTDRTFDQILSELEKTIGILGAGTAPLEELVVAHERASKLLAEAQARLAGLKSQADEAAQLLSE